MGRARVARVSPITDGPDPLVFLRAALKGSDETVVFTIPSADRETDVDVPVKFDEVTLADESGIHFDFTGNDGKVKGRFTPDHSNNGGRRGNLEFTS